MNTTPLGTHLSTDVLAEMLDRERRARERAEQLLEEKSRQLYQTNVDLQNSAIAIEKETHRTKAVFDTAAEGIIIFEQDGLVESLNIAAKRIFGLDDAKCRGLHICDLLPSAAFCTARGGACFVSGIKQLMDESNEILGRRSDGATVPIEFVVGEFTHGGIKTYSGIVRDLTRRKSLEAQLAHAQKLESVGQLAAGIAHELNTPIQFVGDNTRFLKTSFHAINEIFNRVDLLIEQAADVESLRPLVDSIQNAYNEFDLSFIREEVPLAIDQTLAGADNVSRIVQAMKVFSHPGTSDLQEVDLNHSLQSTLTVSRNEWKYCAELETHYCPNLPRIMCLPGELNQAFLNLIVNAAHAIQAKKLSTKGKLTVTTLFEDDLVVVEINDNGTGIPMSIRNRIFDPFFTTKGVGKGTGQGLSICYNIIVEMHKGSLTFESIENVGTTFRVSLPLDPKAIHPHAVES